MILASWTVGQAVWTIFWGALILSIMVAWLLLVVRVVVDIVHQREMSGFGKAIWALFVLVAPLLGVFFYLVVHGDGWYERDYAQA